MYIHIYIYIYVYMCYVCAVLLAITPDLLHEVLVCSIEWCRHSTYEGCLRPNHRWLSERVSDSACLKQWARYEALATTAGTLVCVCVCVCVSFCF